MVLQHLIRTRWFPSEDQIGKHIVEDKHAVRDSKGGLKFVSDGKRDIQKEIESQKCNAGLQNIIKLQTLRYGTIDNAIARNKEKQTFADVSKIPTSVAEQFEMVADSQAAIYKLAKKYNMTVDQVLALKSEQDFVNLVTPKAASNDAAKPAESEVK